MYRSIRTIRIVLALLAMCLPAWALIAGYDSFFRHMQSVLALLTGSVVCLVFWIAATFIYGRIYCSAACPLGTLMDCAAAAGRLPRRRRAYRFHQPMGTARTAFLILAAVLVFAGGPLVPTLLDPYTNYTRIVNEFIVRPLGLADDSVRFTLATFSIAAATLLIVMAGAWRRGRIICNTLCPVGTLLSLPARKSVFHPDINTDKCINCGECERVCKSECINLTSHTVDSSRCVVCFDCMAVCPNGAITYRSGRHRLGMPLVQTATDGGPAAAPQASGIQRQAAGRCHNKSK